MVDSIFEHCKTHIFMMIGFNEMLNPHSRPQEPSVLPKLPPPKQPFNCASISFKPTFPDLMIPARGPQTMSFGSVEILLFKAIGSWARQLRQIAHDRQS